MFQERKNEENLQNVAKSDGKARWMLQVSILSSFFFFSLLRF
jgi:hypothetical protein